MHHGTDPNIAPLLILAAYEGNLNIVKYLLNEEKKFVYSFDWVCHIITFASFLFSFFFKINFVCIVTYILNRTNISIKRIVIMVILRLHIY